MDDLLSRTRAAVWHPCTQMKQLEADPPLAIARGEGAWLVDVDGRRYLDAISSWWVNLFGHCNPRINAAIVDQLGKIEHVMLAGATHAPVVELSERLARLTGLGHAFYGSDGASATEIALKMSAHFWRNAGQAEKNGFVSLQNGYHGETVGALSVTDIPLFKDTYAPLLRHSVQVPTPDARLAEPGETAEAGRCAAPLRWRHTWTSTPPPPRPDVEPWCRGQRGGDVSPAYLPVRAKLCDRYGCTDATRSRWGSAAPARCSLRAGPRSLAGAGIKTVRPDFMCLSKGITGGYLPLSAVLTSDDVYAAFWGDATARGFLHSHSYTGNPLACSAALAVLDIFEHDNVIAANRVRAIEFTSLLAELAAHPRVRHFRHLGMIWAFEVADATPGFSARLHRAALAQGVFIRPIGGTVYAMPPYVTSADEMRALADALLVCLADPEI